MDQGRDVGPASARRSTTGHAARSRRSALTKIFEGPDADAMHLISLFQRRLSIVKARNSRGLSGQAMGPPVDRIVPAVGDP
jgi:hypothetical protein